MEAILITKLQPSMTYQLRYKALFGALCVVKPNQFELNELANAAFVAQELVDSLNTHLSKAKKNYRHTLGDVAALPNGTFCAIVKRKTI